MAPQLTLRNVGRDSRAFRSRVIASAVIMAGLLLAVTIRLVQLQILNHDHFTTLSQENRVKIVPLPPTRGLILSSDGKILAENRPSFSLEVVPERVRDVDLTIAGLNGIVDVSADDRVRFERALKQKRYFEGVPLKFNLSEEEVARFSLDRYRFPGVDIVPQLTRFYPLGPDFVHIVGYVGRIDEDDLTYVDSANYSATNYIGKAGVEKTYEDVLHGRVGYQQVEVNAEGRILRVLETTPPQPGRDLYLTIDSGLQSAAISALAERKGAVVAIDPETGGVLALVSKPGYDPNLFVNGIDAKNYLLLRDAPERPLFNRALQGQYPPGSTVKPIMALGGLQYGLRSPERITWCPGWFALKNQEHHYRDWKKGGHGRVDLRAAIAQSCDVYFYELANDMGIDRLSEFMGKFGFGRRTGIDLPAESAALMPSREWKKRARKLPWYPGETLIAGIGQGFTLVTPLQLASATATLAKRGVSIQPHVVGQIEDAVRHEAIEVTAPEITTIELDRAEYWEWVISAMHEVVQGPTGTARKTGLDASYQYAGKTGTAQLFNIKQDEEADDRDTPEQLRDHALFIAFAPLDAPQIAVAIVVENGGSGSGAAAPVARKIFDHYLLNDQAVGTGVDGG